MLKVYLILLVLFVVVQCQPEPFCNRVPSEVVLVEATASNSTAIRAADGNPGTIYYIWNGQTTRMKINFSDQQRVKQIGVHVSAGNYPNNKQNGGFRGYYSPNPDIETFCSGTGWTQLPFIAVCDVRDNDIFYWNYTGSGAGWPVGAFCLMLNTGSCSPADYFWYPRIREIIVNRDCTPSPSSSRTPSPTRTPSGTPTPSRTPTISKTSSETPSNSGTPSATPTAASNSNTPTISQTNTQTPSGTPTVSETNTGTPTQTPTQTRTPSNTRTQSTTNSQSGSASTTPSHTKAPSSSRTSSKSSSGTRGISTTSTPTKTTERTKSNTPTTTRSFSPTSSTSQSLSATLTPARTPSETTTSTVIVIVPISESTSISLSVSPLPTIPSPLAAISIETEDFAPSRALNQSPLPIFAPSPAQEAVCANGCVTSTMSTSQNTVIEVIGDGIVGTVTASPESIGDGNFQVQISDANTGENPNVVSPVISVTLIDRNSGMDTQPLGNIQICIKADETDKKNGCLAFLNENNNRWECEDPCLSEEDGLLCGETSHLTLFSILVDPTGSSNDCGSDEWNGITGSQWGDYIVILSIAGFVCCCSILFVLFVSVAWPGFHGQEYVRLKELRKSQSLARTTLA